jgi:hypothetical protein
MAPHISPCKKKLTLDSEKKTHPTTREREALWWGCSAPVHDVFWVGIKMKWELLDFFAEKWKQNENMKTEMEFCKAEMKTETEQRFLVE